MSYFIYLWKSETWTRKKAQALAGYAKIDYAAGDRFKSAGIGPGSTVFIVTILKGDLYLGGYIKVARIGDRATAATHLRQPKDQLRSGKEYILAETGSEVNFRDSLLVPSTVSHHIELQKNGGFVHPKLDSEGRLDRQTFRRIRKLYRGSEKLLFDLLKS